MRILLVEADQLLTDFVRNSFEPEYQVEIARDCSEAKALVLRSVYDLVILDIDSPGSGDLELLPRINEELAELPVLVIGPPGTVEDRVKVLDLGADDYLAKPFAMAELAARARSLLRRTTRQAGTVLHVEDLMLDRLHRTVLRGGRQIGMTPKEFTLLEYLMRNTGKIVSRVQILSGAWKITRDINLQVVDVYINYLRKKVDQNGNARLIHTVRGRGYVMTSHIVH